jgi:EAL domain-containing protein (putative c-di-GMP-specific phosphodiesterase class I)/DNA-binding CsgD family transcriptional regulator
LRVLIFDDEPAVGRSISQAAALAGIDALAVTDAASFEVQLHDYEPGLVILDLQLGPTDGIEQMRRLSDAKFSGSLVLMSGFDARVLDTARSLGQRLDLKIVGTLAKPLRLPQVEQMLDHVRSAAEPLSVELLMKAMADDDLTLEFQPVVDRKSRQLKKLEALIRWDYPAKGRISPDAFLPIAECDQECIDALTDWVLAAAVAAYGVLKDLSITVPIAVNVSPRNLHETSFVDRVAERLHDSAMPPRHLCFEVTESAAFSNTVRSMEILSRLRLKGIQLSIDDFGVGYSSLRLLRQMPFTEIKIDQSFIKELDLSADSRVIVKSVIDLATALELDCVAEGVESESVACLVEQLGCTNLQGYFIGRPMPVEAIHSWFTAWRRSLADNPPTDVQAFDQPVLGEHQRRIKPHAPAGTADHAESRPPLSTRQLEVMEVLSDGCSIKEIARRLQISPGTVKVHLALAYTALGARNRIEAVTRLRSYLQAMRSPGAEANPADK